MRLRDTAPTAWFDSVCPRPPQPKAERYQDGGHVDIGIHYGLHLRNRLKDEDPKCTAEPIPFVSEAEGIRCYKRTWENPRPDVAIASIDFSSTRATAAPFLIAITAEPGR